MEGVEYVHVLLSNWLELWVLLAASYLLHLLGVRLVADDGDEEVVALRLGARSGMDARNLHLRGVVRLDRHCQACELMHLRRRTCLALGNSQRSLRLCDCSGRGSVSFITSDHAHESGEGEWNSTVVKNNGVRRLMLIGAVARRHSDLGWRELGSGGGESSGNNTKVEPWIQLGYELKRRQRRRQLFCTCASLF